MDTDDGFNEMQTVKRRMYAMRNGVIADTLRKGGSPFKVIFGLNLPQIVEIAREIGKDSALAESLWANTTTRESMLLAPMLVDPATFAMEDAKRWCESVAAPEVADILCHRLLRHMAYAHDLANLLLESEDEMSHYTGLRLMCNIADKYPAEAEAAARAQLQKGESLTRALASQMLW